MKKNAYNFLSNFAYKIKTMSFAKNLLIIYLLIMLVGAFILWLPISQTGNLSWDPVNAKAHAMGITNWGNGAVGDVYTKGYMSFLDSLFTSASAFSDTGLATNSAAVTYNDFGQAILAILIFIGGLGWFALKVYIFNIIFMRPLTFRSRDALAAERGSVKIGVSRSLIKTVITTLLIITILFSIILSIYFFFEKPSDDLMNYNFQSHNKSQLIQAQMYRSDLIYQNPYHNLMISIKYGVFHTISALNNAGFDIVGNNSFTPYYYDVGLQIMLLILLVIGGIGYPVIYDVIRYFSCKVKGERFVFSLFTKVSMLAYFAIAVIGLSVTFAIEVSSSDLFWNNHNNEYGSVGNKVMAIFFNTMSTRNAGFATINLHDLSQGTLIQYIVMMFIGSAPSSTAGGIRTTTIAIIVLSLWARLRGRSSVYAFKSRISTLTVNKAFIVFFISTALLVISMFISVTSFKEFGGQIWSSKELAYAGGIPPRSPEDDWTLNGKIVYTYSFVDLMFESGSAFGTTGLSTGVTSKLSVYMKIYLVLLMFIGQLGVTSSILVWGKKNNTDKHYKWVKQDITIG